MGRRVEGREENVTEGEKVAQTASGDRIFVRSSVSRLSRRQSERMRMIDCTRSDRSEM